MKLYLGLPLKQIEVNIQGENQTIGVTTEMVDSLISNHLFDDNISDEDTIPEVSAFDDLYGYAVPNDIFELEDSKIVEYIQSFDSDVNESDLVDEFL